MDLGKGSKFLKSVGMEHMGSKPWSEWSNPQQIPPMPIPIPNPSLKKIKKCAKYEGKGMERQTCSSLKLQPTIHTIIYQLFWPPNKPSWRQKQYCALTMTLTPIIHIHAWDQEQWKNTLKYRRRSSRGTKTFKLNTLHSSITL